MLRERVRPNNLHCLHIMKTLTADDLLKHNMTESQVESL